MEDEPRGFVVNRISVPPVRIDCSPFLGGLQPEDYVTGEFVVNRISVPPVTVDCSQFARDEPAGLELAFADGTAGGRVIEATNRAMAEAAAVAPGLGLAYDPARSRGTAPGLRVVLTAAPEPPADLLEAVAAAVRAALADPAVSVRAVAA